MGESERNSFVITEDGKRIALIHEKEGFSNLGRRYVGRSKAQSRDQGAGEGDQAGRSFLEEDPAYRYRG